MHHFFSSFQRSNLFIVLMAIILTGFGMSMVDAQSVSPLEQRLFDLADVRFERVKDVAGMPAYLLNVRQMVDRTNSADGYFHQQVYLIHRGDDKPVVMNTDGYNLTQQPSELFELLDANYISVEHRFFGPSTPESKAWPELTIQHAADDYHHVRELLGELYSGPWISTGISKGGETCTYYRQFYPDDVVLTVPYVAPFPDEFMDPRIYDFLAKMGSDECRKKIFEFQKSVLTKKKEMLPRLKYFLKGRGANVELIGGTEAALELFVLEYPFSFWQSGKREEDIPPADTDCDALLEHLLGADDFAYLFDDSTIGLTAHYYQHATQLGYYGYLTEPFGELIQKWGKEPSACFFPFDKNLNFDTTIRDNLIEWLKTDARDIVFIYGATDTWSACQAELGDNKSLSKYVLPDKHHFNARISQANPDMREAIIRDIRGRLK